MPAEYTLMKFSEYKKSYAFYLLTHPKTQNAIWYFYVSETEILRQMGLNENTCLYSHKIKHDQEVFEAWIEEDINNGYIRD